MGCSSGFSVLFPLTKGYDDKKQNFPQYIKPIRIIAFECLTKVSIRQNYGTTCFFCFFSTNQA